MEREKIAEELSGLASEIEDYLDILRSRDRIRSMMRDEMLTVKEQFATPRRTTIEESELETDIEDLIQKEDMVVTVSHAGYIKRVALSSYRAQRRGGKGRAGMSTRDEDFVSNVFVCNTHTPVLFFSSRGIVYKLKVYRLPEGNPQARGKALINLLPLEEERQSPQSCRCLRMKAAGVNCSYCSLQLPAACGAIAYPTSQILWLTEK